MELNCTLVHDHVYARFENRFSGKCHLPSSAFNQLQLSLGDCVEVGIQNGEVLAQKLIFRDTELSSSFEK